MQADIVLQNIQYFVVPFNCIALRRQAVARCYKPETEWISQ